MLREFSIGAARANISLRLHFTFWTIPPFSEEQRLSLFLFWVSNSFCWLPPIWNRAAWGESFSSAAVLLTEAYAESLWETEAYAEPLLHWAGPRAIEASLWDFSGKIICKAHPWKRNPDVDTHTILLEKTNSANSETLSDDKLGVRSALHFVVNYYSVSSL